MALLFQESAQHYATADILSKWTAGTLSAYNSSVVMNATAGRRAAGAVRCTASAGSGTGMFVGVQKVMIAPVPSGATFIAGFAMSISGAASGIQAVGNGGCVFFQCIDDGTAQWSLSLLPDLSVVMQRGGGYGSTVIATSSGPIGSVGSTVQVQVKVLIHPSAGTLEIRLNGATTPWMTASALNNRNTANAKFTGIQFCMGQAFSAPGLNLDFHDMWCLDATGGAPWNDFLGDCRVDYRKAVGAGLTAWTPVGATPNYNCVDEAAPNGDTDYVETTAPAIETYDCENLPVVGGGIYGVQLVWSIKKSDAGPCQVLPIIRQGTTNQPGAAQYPAGSYGYQTQLFPTNPHTPGVAWTESDFNANTYGLSRT